MLDNSFTIWYHSKQKGRGFMARSMVNIRMDADLKKDVEKICADMGLSLTTAFTLYAKALKRERRIPFEIVGELSEEKQS